MSRKILNVALLACSLRAGRFEAVEPHMGTLVRIAIYAPSPSALPAAFARIRDLDDKLSDYKQDSELNQVCRTAHHHPVQVSSDLFRVLDAAQKLAAETDGAFDVTIGPVTHLWRQGRTPDRETLLRCGYRNLVLDRARRTVFLKLAGMQLDLGGIAKGFAADEALATLRAYGIRQALVAVSGDIAIGDAPPGKQGWRVAVEPAAGELILHNTAVSTSGDTEQSLQLNGVRYSHIIDPKTGLGLTTHIAVTVVARHGIDADSLATAISVMGPDRGRALLKKRFRTASVTYGPH